MRPFLKWNLRYFLVKSVLLQFTLFCRETCFVAIYALSVWRQQTAKMLSVEKKLQISCMPKISPRYPQDQDIPKMSPRYPHDIPKISPPPPPVCVLCIVSRILCFVFRVAPPPPLGNGQVTVRWWEELVGEVKNVTAEQRNCVF